MIPYEELFFGEVVRVIHDTPVILGFFAFSLLALAIDLSTDFWLSFYFLGASGIFEPLHPGFWTGLVLHIFGHTGLDHFASNFALILVVGPALERRYGSFALALMIFFTALLTGIVNVVFFDTFVLGASGIAFMMIILLSMMDARAGEIRMTTILVLFIWIGKEVFAAFFPDQIAHFAHIIGGISGAFFGFLLREHLPWKKPA